MNLNKNIFDNLENPLIFSDYLINIYEKSSNQEFDIKVLSLSGLFVLITKYKLDYNDYYNIMYKTISMRLEDTNGIKSVFDSNHRNRIFKILDLSLKSSTVPILVVLSFIKKLARICLTTSSNNIAIILGIMQNVINSHPRAI
jgi:U3 small nucleolar RNA-associated protein 19